MLPPKSNGPMDSSCDVLIIGAGPSGLMAGQALARLGLHVRLLERRAQGTQHGNADGMQPRTLEIWKSYGMLEEILSKGVALHTLVGYGTRPGEKGISRLSPPTSNIVVDCRYQFEATASITEIEGTLRRHGEAAGVQVTQPCRPVSLEVSEEPVDLEYPVKVVVEHLDSGSLTRSEVIKTKYLIGADGASSWVRQAVGIEMEGEQTEGVSGVVDALIDTDFPDHRFKCIIRGETGMAAIIPREDDKIRFYVHLLPSDNIPKDENGKVDRSALVEEEVREKILARIKQAFQPTYRMEFPKVFWHTIFSAAQRVATQFSYKNRVFIVGDACHTHSPNAGQGANASMGDAHNLAWKLAYVLRGWAQPSILQTYQIERQAYAEKLIAFDREMSVFQRKLPAPEEYARLLHQKNIFTSGMGISYAASSLTPEFSKSMGLVIPGERVLSGLVTRLADWHTMDIHDILVSDGMFKLIVLPGDITREDSMLRLNEFAIATSKALQKGHQEDPSVRLEVYTVVRCVKEEISWTNIPPSIARSWRNCFGIKGKNTDIYERFKIPSNDDGVLILVRPDSYVSIVSGLRPKDGERAVEFVYTL